MPYMNLKSLGHLDLTSEQYEHLDKVLTVDGDACVSLPGCTIAANIAFLKQAKSAITKAQRDLEGLVMGWLKPKTEQE